MFPKWFHGFAVAALSAGAACALLVLVDVVRHPQHMAVMNVVWPVTALFGTAATVWAYFRYGRLATREAVGWAKAANEPMPARAGTPYAAVVGKGALHCGAGCMIGDILAEWLAFCFPALAVAFGWQTIFADRMFAVWILDFAFAFGFGFVL